jgi:hypothetical protein
MSHLQTHGPRMHPVRTGERVWHCAECHELVSVDEVVEHAGAMAEQASQDLAVMRREREGGTGE